MNDNIYQVQDLQIEIDITEQVMPPSPYSLFLARHIPDLEGAVAADVGTGCGIQAIVAKLRGARRVYLLDKNPLAISLALANAAKNHVEGLFPLPPGDVLAPLPEDVLLDVIICNPASLPMRQSDGSDSPYYAGPDGRRMIERLICQSESRLRKGGCLYMVHTSIADVKVTEELLDSLGFEWSVKATERLHFRPFYDQTWIDTLGGAAHGLYEMFSGRAVETLNMVVAVKAPVGSQQSVKAYSDEERRQNHSYERSSDEN